MRATATAQPNIALIKYWGKRDSELNLPAVGSLSITLRDIGTQMSVSFDRNSDRLIVNGEERQDLLPRISACLDAVVGSRRSGASVESTSNFPIAAGLASSASSFAALVVAAASAGSVDRSPEQLANLAGRASGSAARSLYGGFVELENAGDSVIVRPLKQPADWPLVVIIAITDSGAKAVGSTEAMEISRRTSPFFARWVEDQPADLAAARSAVADEDFASLARIAEHNCLKMHSVMWSSRPPVVYWNDATLAVLQAIRALQDAEVDVFFTIDAGPQVKAVCTAEHADTVQETLTRIPGVLDTLRTGLGDGARLVS